MKFKILILTTIIFSVLGLAIFATPSPEPIVIDNSDLKDHNFRVVENKAFDYGEKLEYDVGFKFLNAGEGFFHISPFPVIHRGREAYDVRFSVKTNPSFEWLYKVKNSYTSMIDAKGIFPWRFEQSTREAKFKRDFRADFDQVKNKAIVGKDNYDVPPYIHDIVSAFFHVRTMDLSGMKKDSVFYLKNFFGKKTYNLGVKMLGKQTVEVPAGKFRCMVIEPLVKEGGLFKHEGRLFVWVTDDERKIPVKVATNIIIGQVGAELKSISGITGTIKAKLD